MRATNLGKILGAFGLLLLLSSPLTLFVTAGSVGLFAAKAVLGLVLVGVYVATNFRQFGQFASKRSSFFFISSSLLMLMTLLALVAVNYIATQKAVRWDLTQNKVFTLSPQTVSVLHGLKVPIHVIGFIPTDYPAYEALHSSFERYHAEAPDMFDYTFQDPRRHPDLAAKYSLHEGQVTVVLTRGEGEHEAHTSLNTVSEQELTSALLKLAQTSTQKVYFVIGHGEWSLERNQLLPGQRTRPISVSEFKQQLEQEGYASQELNLAGGTTVPRDAALLIIAGSKSPLTEPEVESLRTYLNSGGRMIYFAEAYGEPGPELAELLAEYGVAIDPGVVADAQFNGGNPYVVLSLFYGQHEITKPLAQRQLNVELATARGLSVLEQGLLPGVKVEPIVRTSPFGWEESTPNDKPRPDPEERKGQIPLMTVSTRSTVTAPYKRFDEARLVVLGDSELLLDSRWGHEGNRNLVMNALAWATHQQDKVTLRPPDRATSTLQLDMGLLGRLRFISTDVLPLSLLGVGLAIWLSRRNQ